MQRHVSSRVFTATLFKDHIWKVVQRNAGKVRAVFESCPPDQPVDVFNLMNRFALDTIGEIGVGKCLGSLDDPSLSFATSFDKAQEIAFWRFHMPFWTLKRFFGVGTERDTRKHVGHIDSYSRRIVRELRRVIDTECQPARPNRMNEGVGRADMEASSSFVGLLLRDAKQRGETLSDDYLRDVSDIL